MTDLHRIVDTLNATASIGTAPPRGPDLQDLANALNRAILPALITARLADGTELQFQVRNRRLYQIISDGLSHPCVGTPLAPENTAEVADFILKACVSTLTEIQSVLHDGPEAESALGIGAVSLIGHLHPQPDDAAPKDIDARIAWLTRQYPQTLIAHFALEEDGLAAISGEAEVLDTLSPAISDLFAHVLDDAFPLLGALETDGCFAVPHGGVEQGCLLIAGRVGSLACLALRNIDAATAATLWRQSDVA